jgi:mono/diheme cytochrome c family protein
MTSSGFKGLCAMAVCLILVLSFGRADEKAGSSGAQLARGKYLVENVAMCGECHSSRKEKGEIVALLQGSDLPFQPTVPIPGWTTKAPAISGKSAWSDADVVALLSTGETTRGIRARPPMPGFRLTRQDALAVVAYLKSLPSAPSEKKDQKVPAR